MTIGFHVLSIKFSALQHPIRNTAIFDFTNWLTIMLETIQNSLEKTGECACSTNLSHRDIVINNVATIRSLLHSMGLPHNQNTPNYVFSY